MAVTFGWKGTLDTDLHFSEFYDSDHSLAIWFLLQYPRSYAGPIFSVNGKGQYLVGQGDGLAGARLVARIERASELYLPTSKIALDAGVWNHLVVVRRADEVSLFVNGHVAGAPLSLTNTDRPSGTLRLGRPGPGIRMDGQEAQFYGVMDELAVYRRALARAEIAAQFTSRHHLTGKESGLLAGWLFSPRPPVDLPASMQRAITRSGQTALVECSADRDGSDIQLIPLPQETMELPFLYGEAWHCSQGFASPFSHRGSAAFCWDFQKADSENSWTDIYPKGSHEAPIYSTGPGEVVFVYDAVPPNIVGEQDTNMVWVRRPDGFIVTYLHLLKNSIQVIVGQTIGRGQRVAQICTEWADVATPPHLHIAMEPDHDDEIGRVTVPSCFSDYEMRSPSGVWSVVPRGIPAAGQVVRRRGPLIAVSLWRRVLNRIETWFQIAFRYRVALPKFVRPLAAWVRRSGRGGRRGSV